MRIVTSKQLFAKYPGNETELTNLLNAITPNVDVLDYVDFLSVRQHISTFQDSVTIVGNDDVINFGRLPNPAQDSDTEVLSDNVYSCMTDPEYLIPSRVISRICDDAINPNFANIKNMLENQAYWMKNKTPNSSWLNFVASVWVGTSTYLENEFGMNSQFVVPTADTNAISTASVGKKFVYGNTHGAENNSDFFGQINATYPIALVPTPGNFKGSLAHFCACYGSYTVNRNTNDSIPMLAIASGALGILGSTSIAYGASNPPLAASDLLAECFFRQVLSGATLGTALMNAKKDYATQTIKNKGSISGAERKSLIQFYLIGICDLVV